MFMGGRVVEGGWIWIAGNVFSCNDRKRGQNHDAIDGDRMYYVDRLLQKEENGSWRGKGRRRQREKLTSGPWP